MGLTYKAFDTRLRIDVALKVIHPAKLGDPDAQRLFIREARAAARVSHPNVASISFLEERESAGAVFYAMEFVDGLSLHSWMRRHGRPRLGQALGFAEQAAHGLSAIHEQQIVHRDLKPPNLMVVQYQGDHPRFRALTASGGCLVKIIDFGLARSSGAPLSPDFAEPDAPLPTTGFRGTVAYASPEQCEEEPDIDGRSDLYSLGCILWEMLAGRPPFVAPNHREMLNQHVSCAPPWETLKNVPEPVVEVLRRLLAKDRTERYHDATGAAEAIVGARRAAGDAVLAPAAVPIGTAGRLKPNSSVSNDARPSEPPPTQRTSSPSTPGGTHITVNLPSRWWIGALAAVVLLAGVVAWAFVARHSRLPPPVAAPVAADPAAQKRTVAVMRFTTVGNDSESENFADGMSEDMLNSLGKIRGLRVVSVASVERRAGGTSEKRDLVGELGVGSVLEGSVRRQGTRFRITTRLNDARTGQQLWSDSYDREAFDAFEIQRTVANEIARALALNLSPGEQEAIVQRPTASAEAYDLFLKARNLQRSGTRTESLQSEVVSLYERALQLDPNFALAWAHISKAHGTVYWFAIDKTPQRIARARGAAETAIRLQPALADGHVALGSALSYQDRDLDRALEAFRVALAIAPGNAEALDAAAHILRRKDRWEEGLVMFRESASLAPDDANKVSALATHLSAMRRYAEAEPIFKRATEISGGNAYREIRYWSCVADRTGDWNIYVSKARELAGRVPPDRRWRVQWMTRDFRAALETIRALPGDDVAAALQRVPKSLLFGRLHRALGEETQAQACFQDAFSKVRAQAEANPSDPGWQMKLADAFAGVGDRENALAMGEAALRLMPETRDGVAAHQLMEEFAQVCADVGAVDRACELLSRILHVEYRLGLLEVRNSPSFDPLRGQPQFETLLRGRL